MKNKRLKKIRKQSLAQKVRKDDWQSKDAVESWILEKHEQRC